MGHVDRIFDKNINAFSEYTKHNFGSHYNLYDRYIELHKSRIRLSGKNVRKDATTFIDSVMSFSLEQWEHLEDKYGHKKLKKAMRILMDDYMKQMKTAYGLEPVGYQFHLDEGYIKNSLKRNIHAHVIFYNYDFEKGVSPWRSLKKKDFSNFQDIAAKAFLKSGFKRGLRKKLTKKKHLEKDEFISVKQKQETQKINHLKKEIVKQKLNLALVQQQLEKEENRMRNLKRSLNKLLKDFSKWLIRFRKNILIGSFDSYYQDEEDIQNVIDDTSEYSSELAGTMTDIANDTAEGLGCGAPFKNKRKKKYNSK